MKALLFLIKSKTAWTAIASIIGAISAAASGHTTWNEAIVACVAALQTLFLRHAIAKVQANAG